MAEVMLLLLQGCWFPQRYGAVWIRDETRYLSPCELQKRHVRIDIHIRVFCLDERIYEILHTICIASFTEQDAALEGTYHKWMLQYHSALSN